MREKIKLTSTNQEVIDVLNLEVEDAINRSFNILRSRIDRFGVTQPNIQRLETAGRILVELPGIKNPERATENYFSQLLNLNFGKHMRQESYLVIYKRLMNT